MTGSKALIAVLSVAGTLSLVACGGGSESTPTLTKQDQQQLSQKTAEFQESLRAVVSGITTCLKDAGQGGGLAGISACVDRLLTKAGTTAQELSTYVSGVQGKVQEKCGKELGSMSSAVKEIASALKTAGTAIGKGDTAGFQTAIAGLSSTGGKLQGAVNAVGTSCVG